MIDLALDQILTLDRAREWLGDRLGRAPSRVTLRRWCHQGIRGHRLESILVGGRRCVSVESIERFVAALSGEKAPSPTARRRRAIEAARREVSRVFGVTAGGGEESP